MDFNLHHPREQIVLIMKRIYQREMTTLSGGNLSIRDEAGNIWITPGGIDKGNLTPDDIIMVTPNGEVDGPHKPSSELPFHQAIYQVRSDLHAVVHAHPSSLVTYSITGKIPNTRITPQAFEICPAIQYAPYAMTGTEALGRNIADTFATGVNIILLENHGVATGGVNLLQAFMRMESLVFCARTNINANGLGQVTTLNDTQLSGVKNLPQMLAVYDPMRHSPIERDLRNQIVNTVHRACERGLMISTEGVVSARIDTDRFLITPSGKDRYTLEIDDIVLIENGQFERGKQPSRSADLHQEIYRQHPEIGSIITAQSPATTAYTLTPVQFDSRTIPEAYIFLRDVPRLSFDTLIADQSGLARAITDHSPVLLIENYGALTTGANLLQAYDRLEIMEYTARSLLQLPRVGTLKALGGDRQREIEEKFVNG